MWIGTSCKWWNQWNSFNEGYTELLAIRFFHKKKPNTYRSFIKIASLLEQFFEKKEDMRNLYFNHNLFGFIHYMEQFAERKEILKLIFDMDKLNYYDSLLMLPLYFYLIKFKNN